MKLVKICVATILFLSIFALSTRAEKENDPDNTLNALNHAIVSIYRVEQFPSRVTIDEEYNDIINNIAWGNITADPELLNLFTEMMNVYTENRLEAKDRELLRRQYEAQVNRAFLEVKPIAHIRSEAMLNTVRNVADGFSSASWLGGAVGAGLGFGEYQLALQANDRIKRQAQGQEQEYMQQRMAGEWELDKEKIRRFNRLKTNLMNAAWPLLNKYNLPDEARLTENNLKQYYQFISEQDVEKALRIGKRIEPTFARFPAFWFHFGRFYLQAGKVKEARMCFEKCEEINRPILRKDVLAAANARYKIFTLNSSERQEAGRLVDIIERQTPEEDWNNIMFAALQNYQLGNQEKAEALLYQNIDNGFNVDVNKELLRQLRHKKFDHNAIQGVVIKEFKEPSELEKLAEAGNTEAQYQYGCAVLLNGAKDIAHKWLNKSSSKGHFFAKCVLLLNYNTPKDKKEAKKILLDLKSYAEEGNSEAQRLLGHFYLLGIIVNKDFLTAVEWYQKAAEQGNSDAQTNLGMMYRDGNGVGKDSAKAVEWFQKAAEQGHSGAQTKLGSMYGNGYGVVKDSAKAVKWYQKAAEQDYSVAQYNLGWMYENGDGVTKDLAKAVEWYQKAAEQGYPAAQDNLGWMYATGNGVTKDLAKAVELFQKAAEQGYSGAQTSLGMMYRDGNGVGKDSAKAVEWFQKAAEQGHSGAQTKLGWMYGNGYGVVKDSAKAVKWYQKAAEQGHSGAQTKLGWMYGNGYGVVKDSAKAVKWYQKAAEQDYSVAQYNLGWMYENGNGVTKDLAKAFEWYQKAAEQGNDIAQYNLGFCYQKGIGVAKDLAKAGKWYQESSKRGNEYAKRALKTLP